MRSEPDARPDPTVPGARREHGLRAWVRDLPRWKKVAVGVALATVAVAGVLTLAAGEPPAATGRGGTAPGFGTSLVEGGRTGGGGTTAAGAEEPAAKGVFRLGFSFLAGFCIGAFVRAALKVAAIAIGFWLLATMVLAQLGVLTVDWNAIGSAWDGIVGDLGEQFSSFRRFVTGSLPTAGLAVAGLTMGLKRS